MSGRYAVYFAPEPGSDLARFGATWLGYDVAIGRAVAQPPVAGIDPERLHAITAEPRRYGFHATLKPPFALADGTEAEALAAAVAALANGIVAFTVPRLHLTRISGFLALTLSESCAAMHDLADRCVSELDGFRALPSASELERRRRANLSARQEALLARWGYPYVMEEFRFHMTLTGRLAAERREELLTMLRQRFATLNLMSLAIDRIALFRQADANSRFTVLRHYPLAAARG